MMQMDGPDWILMVIFWILLIAGIAALAKFFLDSRKTTAAAAPKALEILEERYAKGEIDSKEFEEKRGVLSPKNEK